MTDDEGPRLEVFRIATADGLGEVSVRLPVSRARRAEAVVVRSAGRSPGAGEIVGERWLPTRVVGVEVGDANREAAPLLTFPYAESVADIVAGREPWASVPPVPLPDEGWHDVDEGWWAWLVVHDGWVYAAQTSFDPAFEALAAGEPVAWSGTGEARIGSVPLSWAATPRATWDEAWRVAVERERAGPP